MSSINIDAEAQLFKKKKKKANLTGFVLEEAETPEERQKRLRRQLVNPVRSVLNKFNFSIEKSLGYFTYQNPLENVSIVRNRNNNNLFIVPLGQEGGATQPINAFNNWQTRFTELNVNNIGNESEVVRTNATPVVYKNVGRYNPYVFRLSFSLKKLDKGHFERTGEKRYLNEDLLRLGGGIGFGAMKFKRDYNRQDTDLFIGDYNLQETKLSTTKMFGSITYNLFSRSDFSALVDVYGGVWRIKSEQISDSNVDYDPFFNVGIMLQRTFSKYFKGYIRPNIEMRGYTLANELISTEHKFTVFSIDLGLLLKYPIYPRNKYKADMVQMEHVFNGKMYRGRPFYRKQNPRYGQRRNSRKERSSNFPIINREKSKKGGGNGN